MQNIFFLLEIHEMENIYIIIIKFLSRLDLYNMTASKAPFALEATEIVG